MRDQVARSRRPVVEEGRIARARSDLRLVLVVNPQAHGGRTASCWAEIAGEIESAARVEARLETRGDGENSRRVSEALRACAADVVVAAGGDGTVGEVAQGILEAGTPREPALAIVPLGTANNVARALGMHSCRSGPEALRLAVATVLGGALRRIDVGQVGERCFVGSFAIGMDADILHRRNEYRRRFPLPAAVAGYPLYLWSCTVNLFRGHGGRARLALDGATEETAVYNLLVTNTPIYAGEFRFAGPAAPDDGKLDLLLCSGAASYLREYVCAWPRHLRHQRGDPVLASRRLRSFERLEASLDRPVVAQIDGEEIGASDRYAIRVRPRALAVRVLPSS